MSSNIRLMAFAISLLTYACNGDALVPKSQVMPESDLLGYGPTIPSEACAVRPAQFLRNDSGDSLGTAEIFKDLENRFIRIELWDGWVIHTTDIFLGAKAQFPEDHNQQPRPDQFPFHFKLAKPIHERVFQIPAQAFNQSECPFWAVHCELGQLDLGGNLYNRVDVWLENTDGGLPFLGQYCDPNCTD